MSARVSRSAINTDPRLGFQVTDDRYVTPDVTYWQGYRVDGNRHSIVSTKCGQVHAELTIHDEALDDAIDLLVALREKRDRAVSMAAELADLDAGASQARGHGVVELLSETAAGEVWADELDERRGEAA